MQATCKLCGKEKDLLWSHIIPKSFAKRMKSGAPQVVELTLSNAITASKSNADYKERLLCEECELHIKVRYEDFGTVYLYKKTGASENRDHIIIPRFLYKTYYLFIISIIWRASVSNLEIYNAAKAIHSLEPYLRHCIKNDTLYIGHPGRRLDEFIKVAIARIIDSKNQIKQETLDRLLFSLSAEHGEDAYEGIHYYMVLDGFLITASVLPTSSPLATNWRTPGRLLDRTYLKAPKVCFSFIKPVFEMISSVPTTPSPFESTQKKSHHKSMESKQDS
jgi:hypothetical protein